MPKPYLKNYGIAQRPMKHIEPVMGLLHWPYWETNMSGKSRRLVAGFMFYKIKNLCL